MGERARLLGQTDLDLDLDRERDCADSCVFHISALYIFSAITMVFGFFYFMVLKIMKEDADVDPVYS